MARRIKILNEETVNKIAAGEVVERPASIVKELVENALDAGADSVEVSVVEGGKRLVSVRDSGCGMSREDAVAAFDRHATSKLSRIEDLERLASYGFRGEALSSVAAVAKVTLRTREHGAREGTEVRIQAGKVESALPIGCPEGTDVIVEDLFFNVPARAKAMKSKHVELAHCREVVVNYLLCRPGLGFGFSVEDGVELSHAPAEGVQGSLTLAFGPKVAKGMVFGEADGDGIRVESYLGRLEHTFSSAADLKIFVNDRPVRSQRIVSAVLEGYGSRLMKDRYPVGLVKVFIDGSELDVNVHPTKREVRFADEAKVADAVLRCVEGTLDAPDLSYKYDLTRFAEKFEPTIVTASADATAHAVQATLQLERAESDAGGGSSALVPLAQIMNTYILAESGGSLVLIDQHAASERVVYERLLKAIETGSDITQQLLSPAVVNLSATERRVVEESREALARVGFILEPFGGGAYALRSIPTVLGAAQGEQALRNLLGDLAASAPDRRLGLDIIWRVACHTAIRAGEGLSQAQMHQLVSSLLKTENPYTCEHGRPTMVVLSPADLEKLFKRRV